MTLTQINKAGLDEIALDHVFTIGASGSSAYTFQGEGLNGTVNNPTLYLTRGKTYRFENGSGGHPIRIQSTSGASGTAYNTGVTNNAGSGTVIVEVQHDAPDVLYYQCTSHAAMNGILYITGALADGGVTTAKIADDAVTDAKLANSINAAIAANTAKTSNATHTGDVTGSTSLTIANGAVTEAKLATNAVTTDKINSGVVTNAKLAANAVGTANIADEAVTLAKLPHGTSSNDGKFLRANNGADPTFETVDTTPSFGSQNISTTGTLSSGDIIINSTAPKITFTDSNDNPDYLVQINAGGFLIHDSTNTADRIKINSSGQVGIGTASPVQQAGRGVHIHGTDQTRVKLTNTNSGSTANDGFDIVQESDSDINIVNHENAVIKFSTNGSEGARVDQSGRLLVGTSVEGHAAGDELTVANTGHAGITIRSGTTSRGAIYFSDGTSGADEYRGAVNYDHTENWLRFYTNGSERLRIQNGDGISFNGDTSSANALNDYEEGSWTPDLRFGGGNTSLVYGSRTGKYIKIGGIVIARFGLKLTGRGSSTGSARVYGLPYSGVHGSYYHDAGTTIMTDGGTNSSGGHTLVFVTDSTRLAVRQGTFSNANYDSDHNAFTNSTSLFGTVVYSTIA